MFIIYLLYKNLRQESGAMRECLDIQSITEMLREINPEEMACDLYHLAKSIFSESAVMDFSQTLFDLIIRFVKALWVLCNS